MEPFISNRLFPMIIGKEYVTGKSGKTIEVTNPSTEELVGYAPIASEDEIDFAVKTAQETFFTWRDTPAAERSAMMMRLVNAVQANVDEIARVLTSEQGKPLYAAKGEIGGFCAVVEFYAQEARRIQGLVLQSDAKDRFVYVLRHPMGVIAAIPPWNDPLHLLSRMIGPALASGCTVVAKPSSETPLTTIRLFQIALEAGFPAGVINIITGPGGSVGEALIHHPLIRKVALTGSVEGGRQAMPRGFRIDQGVTLELGGQCPCIVWDDADLDKAADALTFQAFRSTGQVCNRVNRVYAHEEIYDELINRVALLASRIVQGDGFKDGVDIGPLVNARQLKWVSSQVDNAVKKGAKLLAGGIQPGGKGFFYPPTVLGNCTHEMDVMREETFGPVLAFMKIDNDLDKAFYYANDTVFGLSAYFFSKDMRNCYLAAQRLEAGSIWINDIHGSFVHAPYGGMKQSGIGREQGSLAIDDYLEWKTVYQEMSYEPRDARICVHHQEH